MNMFLQVNKNSCNMQIKLVFNNFDDANTYDITDKSNNFVSSITLQPYTLLYIF